MEATTLERAEETAAGVIALWLQHRAGASGRYPDDGYRCDAERLIERLRSSQIGFHYHGAQASGPDGAQ